MREIRIKIQYHHICGINITLRKILENTLASSPDLNNVKKCSKSRGITEKRRPSTTTKAFKYIFKTLMPGIHQSSKVHIQKSNRHWTVMQVFAM